MYYMQTGRDLFDGVGVDEIETFLSEETFSDFDEFPKLIM